MPKNPSPPSPDQRLRKALAAATHERHERLDALFEPMFEDGDPDIYRRFIRMNHACHEAIEPVLEEPLSGIVPDWTSRSRLARLREDMDEMRLSPLPMRPFAPEPLPLPEAAGAGYVLEGSRLGGIVLLRRLNKMTGSRVTPGLSAHYLSAPDGAEGFRSFMQAASAKIDWSEEALLRACDSASKVFDRFLAAAHAAEREAVVLS